LRAEIEPRRPISCAFSSAAQSRTARGLIAPTGVSCSNALDGFEAPARVGARDPAGANGALRAVDARRALPLGRSRVGPISTPGMLRDGVGDADRALRRRTRRRRGRLPPGTVKQRAKQITDDAAPSRSPARARVVLQGADGRRPLDADRMRQALSVLVAAGLVTSDGSPGCACSWPRRRGACCPTIATSTSPAAGCAGARERTRRGRAGGAAGVDPASALRRGVPAAAPRDGGGAVARPDAVYRRLGRARDPRRPRVGMAGEQFALPDAVPVLRDGARRRAAPSTRSPPPTR
jgi:hypothetical protein